MLCNWFKKENINWSGIYMNKNSLSFLEENIDELKRDIINELCNYSDTHYIIKKLVNKHLSNLTKDNWSALASYENLNILYIV